MRFFLRTLLLLIGNKIMINGNVIIIAYFWYSDRLTSQEAVVHLIAAIGICAVAMRGHATIVNREPDRRFRQREYSKSRTVPVARIRVPRPNRAFKQRGGSLIARLSPGLRQLVTDGIQTVSDGTSERPRDAAVPLNKPSSAKRPTAPKTRSRTRSLALITGFVPRVLMRVLASPLLFTLHLVIIGFLFRYQRFDLSDVTAHAIAAAAIFGAAWLLYFVLRRLHRRSLPPGVERFRHPLTVRSRIAAISPVTADFAVLVDRLAGRWNQLIVTGIQAVGEEKPQRSQAM